MVEEKQSLEKKPEKESIVSISWLICGVLIILVGAFFGALIMKGKIGPISYAKNVISTDEAQKKAQATVDELVQNQVEAKVTYKSEEQGLYKFEIAIQGQTFPSYMTKDGSLFFPEAIEQDKVVDTASDNTNTSQTATADLSKVAKADKPIAKLFTMSYCPYGNKAEDVMKPVVDLLGSNITVEPHYVIYDNYASNQKKSWEDYCLDESEKYCSMHGRQELNQDVRELCVYKYQPDKYWDFVAKTNANCTSKNVDTCWEEQARAAGVDTSKIKTCESGEANTLLANEVDLNNKYGVQGSPTLVVNDGQVKVDLTEDSYKQAVCAGFNTQPEACSTTLSGDTGSTDTSAGCAE